MCSELDSSDCALIERSLPPSTPTEPPKKPAPQKKAKTNEDEPEARPLSLARRRSLVAPATTPFGTLTETYEVDRVLASRAGRASLEYLVRWRGWLTCGDTWEPAIHLPEEVIAAFQSVPRLLGVDRREAQRDIAQQLDEDAAEPDHHQRAELFIVADADQNFQPIDHLLH